jgi:hypothetical protein
MYVTHWQYNGIDSDARFKIYLRQKKILGMLRLHVKYLDGCGESIIRIMYSDSVIARPGSAALAVVVLPQR